MRHVLLHVRPGHLFVCHGALSVLRNSQAFLTD